MSFLDVRHQDSAQRQVQRALRSGRIPHACLFHGPEGVGKEMLAIRLAQFLLCSNSVERPAALPSGNILDACGQCSDCQNVLAGRHPDLHLIYRHLHRNHPEAEVRKQSGRELTIDVIRHFLLDRAVLTSKSGRAKVFIVREAHEMSTEAQNALLKTLEEPPAATYLVLLTSAVDRLLATTQSRCQVVRFSLLPRKFVFGKMKEAHPDRPAQELEWCVDFAGGSLGAALQVAEDEFYQTYARLVETLSSDRERDDLLVKRWMEAAKELTDRLLKRDPEMTEAETTRRAIAQLMGFAAHKYRLDLAKAAAENRPADIRRILGQLDAIQASERALNANANTQLVVETLVGNLFEPAPVLV